MTTTNPDNMKELLIQALNDACRLLETQIPLTKRETKSISIADVKPLELIPFMKSNDIPVDDAYFSSGDGDDECEYYEPVISWEIVVPTTDEDKLEFKRNRFTAIAWKCVYDLLTKNGYKRVPFNMGLQKFKDTTIYDMYTSTNFDRLVEYYSLAFVPVENGI
jgi:hypothetical protein